MLRNVPVRRAVAILTSHAGLTTALESEMAAVERAGQPLTRVSVDEHRWSAPIVITLLRTFVRRPGALTRTAATLLLQGGRHRLAALARIPLAVHLAHTLPAKGITHLHATDELASIVAWAAVQAGTLTFSASISNSPGRMILRRIVSTASFIRVADPATLDRRVVAAARRNGVALLPHAPTSGTAFVALLEEHGHNAAPADAPMLEIDWHLLGAERVGLRWMTTRFDAGVAEVTIDDGRTRRNVILKQHRRVPPFDATAAGRAANETATLRSLRAAMPARHTVPEVLLFDERNLTLVMEEAPGLPLDRLFAEAAAENIRIPALLAAIAQAGLWLQELQKATHRDVDARPLATHTIHAAFSDLEEAMQHDRTLRGQSGAIRKELDALGQAILSSMRNGVTGHHGDFWPGNVFFDAAEKKVTVIDLEGYREGVPLEDAAYFLLRTELLARRFRLPTAALQDAFAASYGLHKDDPALRLFTLTKALQTLKHTFHGNLGTPQRIWTVRVLRQAVLRASGL